MLGDREQTEGKGYFHMGPVHYFNPAKESNYSLSVGRFWICTCL